MRKKKEYWGQLTAGGAMNVSGSVFKTNNSGENASTIFEFDHFGFGITPFEGSFPSGNLTYAPNYKIYGTCSDGRGTSSNGVLYTYSLITNTITTIVKFNGTNGSDPLSTPLLSSNGKLYVTASSGGANSYGVLFEYNLSTNVYTKKVDFDNTNGRYPRGGLLEASNGKLYGITSLGGTSSKGVLFEFDTTNNTFNKLVDFDGTNKGESPYDAPIQADNGKLYGLTPLGGANNYGVLYEYDPANATFTKILDFDGTNKGANPYGKLVKANGGKLYGLAKSGGLNNRGVLFEYNTVNNTYTKMIDFNTTTGFEPIGSLMLSSNGKLYGATSAGSSAPYGNGGVFEYDVLLNQITFKNPFANRKISAFPYNNFVLTEVIIPCTPTSSSYTLNACGSYTWSANASTYTTSGTYTHTTTNVGGCDSVIALNLTIKNVSTSTISATVCNSYLWNATTYTTSGTYNRTLSNAGGCDSTITLNLTIIPSPPANAGPDVTICAGSTATIGATPAANCTYSWSSYHIRAIADRAASQTTVLNGYTGRYELRVRDTVTGCVKRDSVWVYVNASPRNKMDVTRSLCLGKSTVFAVSNPKQCSLHVEY